MKSLLSEIYIIRDWSSVVAVGIGVCSSWLFVGSYDYMAPEFPHQPHDSRSDVWSLGCVLLQLVTCTNYNVRQMLDHLTEIKHSTAVLDQLLVDARQVCS